jgi:hypothetical protein
MSAAQQAVGRGRSYTPTQKGGQDMLQWALGLLITEMGELRRRRRAGERGMETTEVAVIAGVIVVAAVALAAILYHVITANESAISGGG